MTTKGLRVYDLWCGGALTNYVASLGRTGGDPDGIDRAGEEILDRFYVKLAEALDDGCREIQILSHSLGTVVAYHGLSGQFVKAAPRGKQLARRYDPIPSLTRLIQNVVTFPVAISMGLVALWYPFIVRREAKALHTVWTDGEQHPYLASAPVTQE